MVVVGLVVVVTEVVFVDVELSEVVSLVVVLGDDVSVVRGQKFSRPAQHC